MSEGAARAGGGAAADDAPGRWGGVRCRHAGGAAASVAAVRALGAWLTERGGLVDALAPAVLPGFGGALLAARDVPAGEPYAAVPAAVVMSVAAVRDMAPAVAAAAACVAAGVGVSRRHLLMLQLLHERARGAASPWAMYMASLPDAVSAATMCVHAPGARAPAAATRRARQCGRPTAD